MADTTDLKSVGVSPCRFESGYPHQTTKKHLSRAEGCFFLSGHDLYRCADLHTTGKVFHILVVHADAAVRDVLADRGGGVGAVNAIVLFRQSHPVGAIDRERAARTALRIR